MHALYSLPLPLFLCVHKYTWLRSSARFISPIGLNEKQRSEGKDREDWSSTRLRLRATNFPLETGILFSILFDIRDRWGGENAAFERCREKGGELSLSFQFSRSSAAKTRFLSVETVIQPHSLISKPIKICNFPSTLNNHYYFFVFPFCARADVRIPRQHRRLALVLSLI